MVTINEDECLKSCNFYGLCAFPMLFGSNLGIKEIELYVDCPKKELMKMAEYQRKSEREEKRSNKQPSI